MNHNYLKLLLALLMSVVSDIVFAHDFEVDGIYYMVTSSIAPLTVTVSYRGDKYDSYDGEYNGNVVIPESVTFNGKVYMVSSIGYYAFNGCNGLTSIIIPSSVKRIGDGAFEGCNGLTFVSINCPTVGLWFRGNDSIRELVIGNNVTSIEKSAFQGCTGLNSITINSNTITSKSSKLSQIFGSQVAEYIFGDDVQGIGDNACYNCSNLTSVRIGNNVSNIGASAFHNCSSLTSVTIPESITRIDSCAFWGCSGLTKAEFGSIKSMCGIEYNDSTANPLYYAHCLYIEGNEVNNLVIPNDITIIGQYAFYNCRNLISISVPNSVTTIGDYAFMGCTGLEKADFACIESLCGIQFGMGNANPLYKAHHLYLGGSEVKDLVIPNGVTSIGRFAFGGCRYLNSVTIPNSVTEIGASAFQGCTGLTKAEFSSIESLCGIQFGSLKANPLYYAHHLYIGGTEVRELVIPEGVTTIGGGAFCGCTGLTSVTIPNNVKRISQSFSDCTGLTSVSIGNSLQTINKNMFSGCTGLTSVSINNGILTHGLFTSLNWTFADLFGPQVKEYVFGDEVKTIDERLCYNCSDLTSVTIGKNVTSIGDYAFGNCNALTSINVPKSVTTIGNYTFQGCTALKNVTMEDRESYVTTEKKYKKYKDWNTSAPASFYHTRHTWEFTAKAGDKLSFYYAVMCSYADKLRIQLDGVEIVYARGNNLNGQSAYYEKTFNDSGQHTLFADYVEDGNFTGTHAASVYNVIIQWDEEITVGEIALGSNGGNPLFADCPLENVYLGRYISYSTSPFYRNTSLRNIRIGDAETKVTSNEFYGCKNLKNVHLGDGITSIGDSAFQSCTSLDYFAFGQNVKTIGKEAFSDCTNVTKIISRANTPPVCGTQALDDINKWNCQLFVPTDYISAYQQADQWKEFFFIKDAVSNPPVDAIQDDIVSIHDASGRQQSQLQKGLNIVRTKDGKTRKLMVR